LCLLGAKLIITAARRSPAGQTMAKERSNGGQLH
jgi:hypothetical protein